MLPPYTHFQAYIQAWKSRAGGKYAPPANATGDGGRLFQLSRNVLLTHDHEDEQHSGALVASLSVPWGSRPDDDDAGYHLVWPRDMTQSATALLAILGLSGLRTTSGARQLFTSVVTFRRCDDQK